MEKKGSITEWLLNTHMQWIANDQHEYAGKESGLKWQHTKILISNNRIYNEKV